MTKLSTVLLLFSMLFMYISTTKAMEDWRETLGLGSEKVTRLHFYFHDTLSGKHPTAIKVAEGAHSSISPTLFGTVFIVDDPLTKGPEVTSKEVGRAQGLYGSAGQKEVGLIMAIDYGFTQGKYKGSSISIMGRNRVMHPIRELPVVGGTGYFRFARGVATAKTHWFNATSGDAIVEYHVTVVHY